MANRKQTPDVLAEVLGGESTTLEIENILPTPRPRTTKTTSPRAQAPKKEKPEKQQWEYQVVSLQDHKGWRPRFANGREFKDWMNGPLIHQYIEQAGDDGWELVAAGSGERLYGSSDNHQLYFKRLK
jgi:Domain of unknown function (DUF4177)